jgi:negative regulator of replication initiation
MATEIFRFMTIRPPQEVDSATAIKNSVNLNNSTNDFLELLVQQRKSDSRDAIERVVQEFRTFNDSGFIDSRKKVNVRFLSLYETLVGLGEKAFFQAARASFSTIFNVEPNTFVQENDFKELFGKVTNSIVIAAIDQNVEPKVRSLLVSLAQTLDAIAKVV